EEQVDRPRSRDDQDRQARREGHVETADRGSGALCRHRPAVLVAAVRILLDGRRKLTERRRAGCKAGARRRDGGGGLGDDVTINRAHDHTGALARSKGGPTPPDIVRSAYAELHVSDLERSRWFWVDLIGFAVTAEEPGALYLRGYDELTHHNLVLRQSATP